MSELRLTRRFDAAPERVYTWRWEGVPSATLVTVEFHPDGEGTRVELHHAGFPDERDRDMHADGWGACLDNLARRVFANG